MNNGDMQRKLKEEDCSKSQKEKLLTGSVKFKIDYSHHGHTF
jgi:hypothetical protein